MFNISRSYCIAVVPLLYITVAVFFFFNFLRAKQKLLYTYIYIRERKKKKKKNEGPILTSRENARHRRRCWGTTDTGGTAGALLVRYRHQRSHRRRCWCARPPLRVSRGRAYVSPCPCDVLAFVLRALYKVAGTSYHNRPKSLANAKWCAKFARLVFLPYLCSRNHKNDKRMENIKFDRRNYRRHSDSNKQMIRQSLEECGAGRSVLIDSTGELIAGNGVYEQAQKLGLPVRVVESDGSELVVVKRTDLAPADAKRKKLALADNAIADRVEWNLEQIKVDFSVPEIKALGIDVPTVMTDDEEIARKEAEFRERMAAGEISEEDEEYQEFLDKFKLKKTTDDCYTPAVVYDAVADYVARTYNVSRAKFVRPFYPNGDYQKEKYPRGCVVVDNPPFSILSEILKFYKAKNIAFFLFAPTLTLFSSAGSSAVCALPCGVAITYANGANVNTSFLTSFEAGKVRLKSCPELYAAVKAANDKNLAEMHRELPKYVYPLEVVTSTKVAAYSRLGIEFAVPVDESEPVSKLDAQKDKTIYGKGYFISRRVLAERERAERERAERERAERERAERERAERFELSEREKEIINRLTK